MTRGERWGLLIAVVRGGRRALGDAAVPSGPSAPGSELPNEVTRNHQIFYAALYPMGRQHEREGVSLGYPRNRAEQ